MFVHKEISRGLCPLSAYPSTQDTGFSKKPPSVFATKNSNPMTVAAFFQGSWPEISSFVYQNRKTPCFSSTKPYFFYPGIPADMDMRQYITSQTSCQCLECALNVSLLWADSPHCIIFSIEPMCLMRVQGANNGRKLNSSSGLILRTLATGTAGSIGIVSGCPGGRSCISVPAACSRGLFPKGQPAFDKHQLRPARVANSLKRILTENHQVGKEEATVNIPDPVHSDKAPEKSWARSLCLKTPVFFYTPGCSEGFSGCSAPLKMPCQIPSGSHFNIWWQEKP